MMNLPRFFAIVAAAAIVVSAYAVPARRVPYTVTQPDGSTLTLTKIGDEYGHYYVTDDNQMVLRKGEGYYFARIDENGALAASEVLAADIDKRNVAQRAFLQKTNAQSLFDAFAAQRQAAPQQKARMAAAPQQASANPSAGVGLFSDSKFPTKGEVKSIVILVEYQDVKFSYSDEDTYTYFNNMLNQPGFNENKAIGSAWDYFQDASDKQFSPKFDVFGPLTLPQNREYYGKNYQQYGDLQPYKMVTDAVDMLNERGFDLSAYDNDGDNVIDNVFIYFAGLGEHLSDETTAVWPHKGSVKDFIGHRIGYLIGQTGIYVNNYACSCEISMDRKTRDGIGTFCHEFSHVLGLPDIYDTANNGIFTPGPYSELDQGPYNGAGRVPPTYSSFERNALGWCDPIVIDGSCEIELPPLLASNKAYIIPSSDKNEFYLIENRQHKIEGTWDRDIPGHGMIIWHITYNAKRWDGNIVNTIETKQYVDLIEADGSTLDNYNYNAMKQYPFPGTKKVYEFTDFATWKNGNLPYTLTDISEIYKGNVTAKINDVSGIADIIAPGMDVRVEGRTISVDGASAIEVYDLAGRKVTQGHSAVTVPATGLYILKAGAHTTKLAVK